MSQSVIKRFEKDRILLDQHLRWYYEIFEIEVDWSVRFLDKMCQKLPWCATNSTWCRSNAPPVGKNDRVRTKRSLIITGSCISLPRLENARDRLFLFFWPFNLAFCPCHVHYSTTGGNLNALSNVHQTRFFCHYQDTVQHKYLGPWNEIL